MLGSFYWWWIIICQDCWGKMSLRSTENSFFQFVLETGSNYRGSVTSTFWSVYFPSNLFQFAFHFDGQRRFQSWKPQDLFFFETHIPSSDVSCVSNLKKRHLRSFGKCQVEHPSNHPPKNHHWCHPIFSMTSLLLFSLKNDDQTHNVWLSHPKQLKNLMVAPAENVLTLDEKCLGDGESPTRRNLDCVDHDGAM